ncbi:SEC62-like protein [Mya arenaria]|uniref:Translocation protein SEC62 n=1 Tax=Mya arenaria TaxID=6604 RepID=A0ABY7EV83_MYAAR|nr:SEC62-like protein [Mya arenaria]
MDCSDGCGDDGPSSQIEWVDLGSHPEEQACTKEEYAVAKYLRFNCPAHTGKLAGMTWAKGKANPDSEIVFTDRKSISQFLNRYIQKGLFHRADKMESKSQKERKRKKKEEEEKAKKAKKKTDKTEKTEKNEVKLKKFKLNMSEDQRFVDGNSIYVWIYDPIHPKTFFIGFLMLLGAVALCLFPLWPDWMRIAVYYAMRVIVFSIVWVLTLGKHHLWIFPNLTEDVGVLDSFKPLYKHDVYPPPEIEKELEDDKKKKDEDAEAEDSENGDDKNEDFEMINDKNGDSNADDRTGEESGEGEEN